MTTISIYEMHHSKSILYRYAYAFKQKHKLLLNRIKHFVRNLTFNSLVHFAFCLKFNRTAFISLFLSICDCMFVLLMLMMIAVAISVQFFLFGHFTRMPIYHRNCSKRLRTLARHTMGIENPS